MKCALHGPPSNRRVRWAKTTGAFPTETTADQCISPRSSAACRQWQSLHVIVRPTMNAVSAKGNGNYGTGNETSYGNAAWYIAKLFGGSDSKPSTLHKTSTGKTLHVKRPDAFSLPSATPAHYGRILHLENCLDRSASQAAIEVADHEFAVMRCRPFGMNTQNPALMDPGRWRSRRLRKKSQILSVCLRPPRRNGHPPPSTRQAKLLSAAPDTFSGRDHGHSCGHLPAREQLGICGGRSEWILCDATSSPIGNPLSGCGRTAVGSCWAACRSSLRRPGESIPQPLQAPRVQASGTKANRNLPPSSCRPAGEESGAGQAAPLGSPDDSAGRCPAVHT